MKYKLLAMSTEAHVNIGDYVQALASSQFLPAVDGFIERECLNQYDGDESKVIMNGWYMHHSENWPPVSNIKPLFVAFHINSMAKNALLSDKSIAYLKKHQPIGCRDFKTREMLVEKGVDAYFSACMTLTLGRNFASEEKEDKCYFVDPCINYDVKNIYLSILSLINLIFNCSSICKIYKKYPLEGKKIKKLLLISNFYKQYRALFTEDTLVNAEYICQQNSYYKNNFVSNEDRLTEAERLVKKYAKAKLVVTSRIHCALPCLGLETPVIYTYNSSQDEVSFCRFGGLQDLFNIARWTNNHLEPDFEHSGRLSKDNTGSNKTLWKKYRDILEHKCVLFTDK